MREKEIYIDFSRNYDFKFTEIEGVNNQLKLAEMVSNEKIFNKEKFRLCSYNSTEYSVHMKIGITSYFEYLLTNHNKYNCTELERKGVVMHNNAGYYLSNCIGNVAIILLSDKKIVLPKRNSSVATFKNVYDFPGGHPEPESTSEYTEHLIKKEFSDSILQELKEEFDFTKKYCKSITFLDLVINKYDGNSPELIYIVHSDLSSKEFTKISKDALNREHSDIYYYDPFKTNSTKRIRMSRFSQTLLAKVARTEIFKYSD